MSDALAETDRYPWLTEDSRRLLLWLHEHPSAPRFNHRCGDRLTADGLDRIRQFEAALSAQPPAWRPGVPPDWAREFVAHCFQEVPFYRRYGAPPARFEDVPTASRAGLSREPWAFVPDSLPLDDLIVYNTSGATGHPLDVLSHPETASRYLPLLRAALRWHGVELEGGHDPRSGLARVALVLVCFQRRTCTYASVSAFLGGAGFAKLNLNPDEWRDPADRAHYLDDCQPEVFTGDPISFAELARLPLRHRPKALISTAMHLLPGLRAELENRFDCPVLDLYAMNEAGPIAAFTPAGYALLQPRLYIEVLDADGQPCSPGVRGEVVLTGGFNPFLPLLRYRTGDFASLAFNGSQPMLIGLEGRQPIVFRGADGRDINNIDVTAALNSFALAWYQLHQAADGALTMTVPAAGAELQALRQALASLFGSGQPLEIIEAAGLPAGKVLQYTRAAADP